MKVANSVEYSHFGNELTGNPVHKQSDWHVICIGIGAGSYYSYLSLGNRRRMIGTSRILVVLLLCLSSCMSLAQPGSYSTTNKKAIKKYNEARALFDSRQSEMALESLDAAIKADPNFVEAWLMKGVLNEEKRDYPGARAAYEKAAEINPQFFPNVFYNLGRIEMDNGDYADAKGNFETFLKQTGTSPKLVTMAKNRLQSCEFAITAIANPVPFDPKNMGEAINTDFNEYFPSLTADDNTLLYTRELRETINGVEDRQEDFYISTKTNGVWGLAQNMGRPINTPTNEGAPTLSADGGTMIFTACHDEFGSYGGTRRGNGSCDLFYSYKVGDKWSSPRNLGKTVNSYHWESQPSYSADGSTIYFVRSRKNRDGILEPADIFMTQLQEDGSWSKPAKLSETINTPGHEASVMIHPDGQTLYFSSDGHMGMGGLDIFVSRKKPNGEWGKPINLGYPINTESDENSLLVSTSGEIAYFASNREGGFGGLDLYSFELPENVRPQPVTYLKGTVFDKNTKKPLEAVFELIDLETGDVVVTSFSNPGNGDFLVSLPAGKDYALNVSRNGYMFYSDNFEMGAGSITDPFLKDVPMTPIEVAPPDAPGVVLKNVYFETAKFDLKTKSRVELDKLVSFLTVNASIHIELGGHTDDRGDEKDNQILSENRANAVRDYLIGKGIDGGRMTAVGYGEKRPIADNGTEEGRAQNRRTEYKITKK